MDALSGLVFDAAEEDVGFRAGIPRRLLLVRRKQGGPERAHSQAADAVAHIPGTPGPCSQEPSSPSCADPAELGGLGRTGVLLVVCDREPTVLCEQPLCAGAGPVGLHGCHCRGSGETSA